MAVNRGVIRVHAELIHSLLHLPEDMRVVNFGVDPDGQTFRVVVEADAIPPTVEGGSLFELTPTYLRFEDEAGARVTLTGLGLPGD